MTLPRNILMSLLAVVLTVSLIAPHICMDNNNGMAKAEQQQQAKVEKHTGHQHNTKTGDHCCITHHCCAAKLLNLSGSTTIAFSAKVKLFTATDDHFSSLNLQGFDRPPKFFA